MPADLKVVKVRDVNEVSAVLTGRGHDFWITVLTERNYRACKEALQNVRLRHDAGHREYAHEVFSHAYVLSVPRPKAVANSIMDTFGLGLRKCRMRCSKRAAGWVAVLVRIDGESTLARAVRAVPDDSRRLSGDERLRRSHVTFDITSVEGLGQAAAASSGRFLLTAFSICAAQECCRRVVTSQWHEDFSRCLIAEVPNCREAAASFEARYGSGARNNLVRARSRSGCLALLLRPREAAAAADRVQALAPAAAARPLPLPAPDPGAGGAAGSGAGGQSASAKMAPVLSHFVRSSLASAEQKQMERVERQMADLRRSGEEFREMAPEARLQRAAQLACDMASAVVEYRPSKVCRLLRRLAGALEAPRGPAAAPAAAAAVKRERPEVCEQATLRKALCTGLGHLDLEDSNTRLCIADVVTHLGSMMATFIFKHGSLKPAQCEGEWRALRALVQSAFAAAGPPAAAAAGSGLGSGASGSASLAEGASAQRTAAPAPGRAVKREHSADAAAEPLGHRSRRFVGLRSGQGGTHDLAP